MLKVSYRIIFVIIIGMANSLVAMAESEIGQGRILEIKSEIPLQIQPLGLIEGFVADLKNHEGVKFTASALFLKGRLLPDANPDLSAFNEGWSACSIFITDETIAIGNDYFITPKSFIVQKRQTRFLTLSGGSKPVFINCYTVGNVSHRHEDEADYQLIPVKGFPEKVLLEAFGDYLEIGPREGQRIEI